MCHFVCKLQVLIFSIGQRRTFYNLNSGWIWFVCCPTSSTGFIGVLGEIYVARLVVERYLK